MRFKVFFYILFLLITQICTSQKEVELYPLQNPVDKHYLKNNLKKTLPRLVYTEDILNVVKSKIKTDPIIKNMYQAVKLNAENIYKQPFLERKMRGKRLLHISRELLYRISILGFIYLVEEDAKTLNRLNRELIAVCEFEDWNPKHFLDVGEMAMGVSLALDWTQGKLPKTTIALCKKALINKALITSWPKNNKPWRIAQNTNNWNQVCQGGLIAAAITVAEDQPELAAKTIHRALNGLPYALTAYAPSGVYPEGATYWSYATSYSVATIAMFESAFNTDFGHADTPGFKESAVFRSLAVSHSGLYYNFFDCGTKRSANGDQTLAWFATKTGISNFFEKERFLMSPENMTKLSRLTGLAMSWMSLFEPKSSVKLPEFWKGDGVNPVVIFKSNSNSKNLYYLGCKGGKATLSHGNMDAGSFVFELNGVRWALDVGNQNYNNLEKIGFDLWNRNQDSDRWTLLSKNNFGHSTLSVNNALFVNDAYVPLVNFYDEPQPKASFDLTAVYGNNAKKVIRNFIKDTDTSLKIEDYFETSEQTETITWQMISDADVEITSYGALLSKGNKQLKLENLSHQNIPVSIVSLDPPPLKIDSKIKNLKRIEIRLKAEDIYKNNTLKIRLSEIQ